MYKQLTSFIYAMLFSHLCSPNDSQEPKAVQQVTEGKSKPAYCCVPLCHMNADSARIENATMHRYDMNLLEHIKILFSARLILSSS